MTAALLSAVNHLDDLPAEPDISPRAVRSVLRVYAKIAQHDGTFRYGLRGSKIAAWPSTAWQPSDVSSATSSSMATWKRSKSAAAGPPPAGGSS